MTLLIGAEGSPKRFHARDHEGSTALGNPPSGINDPAIREQDRPFRWLLDRVSMTVTDVNVSTHEEKEP